MIPFIIEVYQCMWTNAEFSLIVLICRSGIDQIHIQLFYDYLLNELLSQHFLSGADKQSTFGMIFKRESHLMLDPEDSSDSRIRSSSLSLFGTSNNQGVNSSNSKGSNSNYSEDRDNESFMTASSTTVEGREDAEGSSRRYHMLIYKAEQSYLTILIPGR
jgi:hypothetical protein